MARTVDSHEKLEQAIDDLREEGWKVSDSTSDRAVMRKNDYGGFGAHLIIALFTAWWTLGLVNLAYAAKRYWMNSRQRVIRVQE